MIGALTLFESSGKPLAKRWRLGADGKPVKETAAQLSRGTYKVLGFSSAQELADLIGSVTTQQAISASLPIGGGVK